MPLTDWLSRIEQLHPSEIELGLDRIRRVYHQLGSPRPAQQVVTIAGTNGKGSTVAIFERLLQAAGTAHGSYTSPHIHHFNERIRINGEHISDEALVEAFEQIEAAREQCTEPTSLTYFEYTTLAALICMARQTLDVALLEVGLGGRLDAVNLIDADVAIVTSIDLDHTEWLGPDRESIGFEKAGVFRNGRAAIFAARDMPVSIKSHADEIGARLIRCGRDYHIVRSNDHWSLTAEGIELSELPRPAIAGDVQLNNAAAAMMALDQLDRLEKIDRESLDRALCTISLSGRFQTLQTDPDIVVDVAHNGAAAAVLAGSIRDKLAARNAGQYSRPVEVHLVLATLADKQASALVTALLDVVSHWYISAHRRQQAGSRWHSAADLMAVLREPLRGQSVVVLDELATALDMATGRAAKQDIIVCCGSFLTVSEISREFQSTDLS